MHTFIGITTGMLGSAVEITLPKILDFSFAFFGLLGAAIMMCWRKSVRCRQFIRKWITRLVRFCRRRRNLTAVSPIHILVEPRRFSDASVTSTTSF
jgi:hypothetical protein